MTITKHLKVYGRVQGVFFRESMSRQAEALGVGGWVRNRRDGSVEAMLHGDQSAVETLIQWARTGPEMARVDGIEVSPAVGAYTGFECRDTV
jgi:acylphosphatase